MSSQLVDMDSDGHQDILVGSFCGVPQLIKGNANGYGVPEPITDGEGQTVLIADFWNYDSKKWDKTDRAESEGHCTSVSAVDWDADGDLDLLLGDYYGGRLVLRINEGSSSEPKFASTNQPIMAAGEPIVIEHGLAAPRIVDWNDDGLFDILCGGAKGGVYLFANIGEASAPSFGEAEVLLEPVSDPSNSYVRRVPAIDGQPTLPGSSYHIEPCDYDGDGDLDLLVGGRSSWLKEPVKEVSAEERRTFEEAQAKMQETIGKLVKLSEQAKTDEERRELVKREDYQELLAEYQKLAATQQRLAPEPTQSGDFVWLYRRR